MSTKIGHNLDWIYSAYQHKLSDLVNTNSEDKLLLCHFGNMNQPKIESLLKIIESSVLECGDKRQTMKRLCVLTVEVLQNIALHGTVDSKGLMHSYVTLTRSDKIFKLSTGSLIMETDIVPLRQKLELLNGMDENTLRKLYIETLCNDQFSNKGGAGLGLLTIAKKSADKLKFELDTLADHFGYFQLEVSLSVE